MDKQDLKNEMLQEFDLILPNGKIKESRKSRIAEITFNTFWDSITNFPSISKTEVIDEVRYAFGINFIAWWLLKYFVIQLVNFLYKKYFNEQQ